MLHRETGALSSSYIDERNGQTNGYRRVDPCDAESRLFDGIGYAALARRLVFAGVFFAAGGAGALG